MTLFHRTEDLKSFKWARPIVDSGVTSNGLDYGGRIHAGPQALKRSEHVPTLPPRIPNQYRPGRGGSVHHCPELGGRRTKLLIKNKSDECVK